MVGEFFFHSTTGSSRLALGRNFRDRHQTVVAAAHLSREPNASPVHSQCMGTPEARQVLNALTGDSPDTPADPRSGPP